MEQLVVRKSSKRVKHFVHQSIEILTSLPLGGAEVYVTDGLTR